MLQHTWHLLGQLSVAQAYVLLVGVQIGLALVFLTAYGAALVLKR